jgi:hypothetical protein
MTAVQVSMMIRTVGNRQLQQMGNTRSVCAMLCEVTNKRVFTRYPLSPQGWSKKKISEKMGRKQLVSSAQQHTYTSVIGGQEMPFEVQYNGFGAFTIYRNQLFLVSVTKTFSES